MSDESAENLIAVGVHVIVKKHNFSKVHKVSENDVREESEGGDARGRRQTVLEHLRDDSEARSKNTYSLRLVERTESLNDLSGQDNRLIVDYGTSQGLSKNEILRLQKPGKSGKEIIGSLIENSASFAAKTEYSQEKYIRKKKRKQYHEKIGDLRMDALAQILCYSDVQADGLHLLYDSGCQGLPAAAMLNRIGENTSGHLINLHPGNVPQTAIVQAMNFPQELRDRHVAVNIYSFLRLHYQGESSMLDNISTSSKKVTDHIVERSVEKLNGETKSDEVSRTDTDISELETDAGENSTLFLRDAEKDADTLKRKLHEFEEAEEAVPVKKPKWFLETQRALDLLNSSKVRGLTVIAKEHPLNIVNALLPFLGASRPFVIFHTYREPLQETFMELKQKRNAINMRLFTNFLRSYQVLPDRTHPDILMSDTGGYILTGYLVQE
ncbi:trna adenine-n-methyltransferase non-catalytic subunit trm6 [Lasius niger]|uniref:tRNA (adenine(58)-N(1))-methyltransferase non-catalytic subunit TRM6 n=1 Tax=Lasius niger TaxID=67767 RepID=A0A0J7K9R4_LASNI|nr:trna adenine-n-methyltransferase non-catalytic subunit trm6 [Lasius niger]